MQSVSSWNDLARYGIVPLTAEACGLMYRLLFDLTERGRHIVGKCLGLPDLNLAPPWNRGSEQEPHVGSIMLAQEIMVPLAIFALLESGCGEVWQTEHGVIGFEPSDDPAIVEWQKQRHAPLGRRFRYGGTAGDRNRHLMSGRVR